MPALRLRRFKCCRPSAALVAAERGSMNAGFRAPSCRALAQATVPSPTGLRVLLTLQRTGSVPLRACPSFDSHALRQVSRTRLVATAGPVGPSHRWRDVSLRRKPRHLARLRRCRCAAQAGHGHSTVTDLARLRGVACGARPALRAFTSLARCERTPKPRTRPRPSGAGPCGPRSACPSLDGHALR
jgi:hypothetical protein